MNHLQILEQMLSFSLQQHAIKDKTIEDLQKQIAEGQKTSKPAKEIKIAN